MSCGAKTHSSHLYHSHQSIKQWTNIMLYNCVCYMQAPGPGLTCRSLGPNQYQSDSASNCSYLCHPVPYPSAQTQRLCGIRKSHTSWTPGPASSHLIKLTNRSLILFWRLSLKLGGNCAIAASGRVTATSAGKLAVLCSCLDIDRPLLGLFYSFLPIWSVPQYQAFPGQEVLLGDVVLLLSP